LRAGNLTSFEKVKEGELLFSTVPETRTEESLPLIQGNPFPGTQYVARRVDRAYQNFFRRIEERRSEKQQTGGFQRFKPRQRYRSITYPQSGFDALENGHLKLSDCIFHCDSCGLVIDRISTQPSTSTIEIWKN